MATAKQISAPITIGNQGSGNINIGTGLNRIVLPGLTVSQPLRLDGISQITTGNVNLIDITGGAPNSVATTISGVATWSNSSIFSSINMTVPVEFTITGVPSVAPTSTINISKAVQLPRLFYASPSISGIPSFRIIDNNDLPMLGFTNGGTGMTIIRPAGSVAYSNGTAIAYTTVGTPGQILTRGPIFGSVIWTTLSSVGTITSISVNDNSTGLNLAATPNPITVAGTINLTGVLDPNHGGLGINGLILNGGDTFYSTGPNNISVLHTGIDGDILTLASSLPDWATPIGGGTITSIAVNTTSILAPTVTNPLGPNTIIDIGLSSQLQNLVLASLDGASGVPTFRALLNNDMPIVNVSHGGTGLSTVGPSESILFSDGSSLNFTTGPTSVGQVLMSTASTPAWTTIGGGTVSSIGFNTGSSGLIVTSNTTNPITSIGTFTLSGLLNSSAGGTGNAGPFSNGDILYYNGGIFSSLAIGSINQVLTVAGGNPVWNNPIGTGTLTSINMVLSTELSNIINVSGSPVFGAGGTFTLDLLTQNPNTFLAGPSFGASTKPSFRTITNGDLPIINIAHGGTNSTSAPVAGEVVYGDGSSYRFTTSNTASQILISNAGAAPSWMSLSGVGTVTSVDGSGGVTGMTLSGGPITTSGTLTLGATLDIGSGGTNLTTFNTGDLLYASAIDTLTQLPIGASGTVLTVNAGTATWLPLPGVGSVTSVGLSVPSIFSVIGSPIVGAGTFAVSLNNESANRVFAGPNSGVPDVPTFKSLVNNDMPTVDVSHGGTNSTIGLAGNRIMMSTVSSIVELSPVGNTTQVLSSLGAGSFPTWRTIGAGGTVTSVAGAAGTSGLPITSSPNPITVSGTLQVGVGTLLATFGGTGQNTFAVGDLLYADTITTIAKRTIGTAGQLLSSVGGLPAWVNKSALTMVTTVTASSPLSSTLGSTPNISLTGIIPIANGGTNSNSVLNNNRIMISSGGSIVEFLPGTAGQVLTSNGAGADPSWTSASSLGVSRFSGNTTGLTPGGVPGASGNIVLSGTLQFQSGGTRNTIIGGAGSVSYFNGTQYSFTAVGSANQILLSGGSFTPVWSTLTAGSNITIVNGVGTITISNAPFVKPILVQDTFSVVVGAPTSLNVLANDTFPNPFSSMLVTTTLDPTVEGSFSSLTTNPLSFTPKTEAINPMIFGYQATDNLSRKDNTLCKIIPNKSISSGTKLLATFSPGSTSISILDMATGTTSAFPITFPYKVSEIAMNRNANILYSFDGGVPNTIRAYNLGTGFNFNLITDYTNIPGFSGAIKGMGFDNNRSILYIMSLPTNIAALYLGPVTGSSQPFTSLLRTPSIPTSSGMADISVEPISGYLYISGKNGLSQYITIYDFQNDVIISTNVIEPAFGILTIHSGFTNNASFYVRRANSNTITRYNPNTWASISSVAAPATAIFDLAELPYGY